MSVAAAAVADRPYNRSVARPAVDPEKVVDERPGGLFLLVVRFGAPKPPAGAVLERAFAARRFVAAAAGVERRAAAVQHVDAVLVEIRSGDAARAAVNDVVGARGAAAAGA